jgi:hypothetical protein
VLWHGRGRRLIVFHSRDIAERAITAGVLRQSDLATDSAVDAQDPNGDASPFGTSDRNSACVFFSWGGWVIDWQPLKTSTRTASRSHRLMVPSGGMGMGWGCDAVVTGDDRDR